MMVLSDLADDGMFKKLIVATLSNEITKLIDTIIVSKKLTFTQQIAVQNFRDRGIIDAIIVGDFKSVTVDDLLELFAIFNVGLVLTTITKEQCIKNGQLLTHH